MTAATSSQDFQDLERQAHRYDAQDGLTEFLAGIMFFFIARVVAEPHLAWVPALLIFPMRWVARFFKTRFTYPRVGFVKLKSEDSRTFGTGVLTFLGAVLCIMAAGLWVFGDITSWALGRGLACLVVGVGVFLVFLGTHPVRTGEADDEQV